ncbi:MAG: hypothetical protein Q8J88_11810 [Bacteroidales bacterium]|nr:hypothetical protein [Bacteroidales bacterium]
MIENILISIAANIITGVGQSALKKIINNGDLEHEIFKAFENALNQWTVNYGIKEKEKIFTNSRFSELIECIKEPKKIDSLEKSTADIIALFKLELQKSNTAWNYIEDIHFQNLINKLNALEIHLTELSSSLNKKIEIIEKTFDDALVPYTIAFKHQMDEKNVDLPNQFHNLFVGRKSDLDNIEYLIKFSDKKVISVIGDGGYGKSRLTIEYFKLHVDNDNNCEAFVLDVSAYKSLNFASQLKSDKQIIILVDDAHKYPTILNDIINTANRYDNVKVLLTVRKALYEDTIKELSTHNRNIGVQKIERLSYEETQELFKSQLPGLKDIELKKLAEESKGIPIVVLGLCQITLQGKYKTELSEEANFKLFVRELKNQVIDDIHNKHLIEKEKINKTIQLISFFSPIKNSEDEIIELSNLNDINVDETNLIIDYLLEYELISKSAEIHIKPDPYSDTILLDSAARIKYLLKKDIKTFIDRLIRNLVEVEQSERLDLSIDNLLSEFISSFKNKPTDTNDDTKLLESNLDTLKSFTFKKPQVCFLAVSHLITSQLGNDKFWKADDALDIFSNSFKTIHESIETILSIVAINTHKTSEFDSIYLLLNQYVNRKKKSKIFNNVFQYRIYDFYEYGYRPLQPCERQQYLISKLKYRIKHEELTNELYYHNLGSCQTILAQEFEGENHYDKYTHSFSFGRHHVVANKTIEDLRKDALNLLIDIYNAKRHTTESKECLDQLIRILFYMAKPRQSEYQLNQNEEIEIVVAFLKGLLNNQPSILERSSIIRQLKLFERRELKEEYAGVSHELLKIAESVNTPKEKLELVFYDEYFSIRKNIKETLEGIIKDYNDWDVFFRDLIEIKSNISNKEFSNFNEIISQLISHYPNEAKALLEFVFEKSPEFICDFSTLIKANYKDQAYFYDTIHKIWVLEYECVKGSVLLMLTNGRNREIEFYRETDLKFVEYAVQNKLLNALWSISFTLPKYLSIAPEKTIGLISQILKISEYQRENELLIHALFEDKELLMKNADLIKTFIFNETLTIPLDSYYFDNALFFLEDNFGFDCLFDYLKERVSILEKENNYFSLSLHKHYNNPNKNETKIELDYLKVINWFAELPIKNEYLHKKIVEFFRPTQLISPEFYSGFKKLVVDAGGDRIKIVDLFNALDVYENKNESIVCLIIEILNSLCDKFEFDNYELAHIFGSNFINNHGLKSGPAGGPFPQDLNKRDELNMYLEKYPMHNRVKEMFTYALERVNKDIEGDRFIDIDEKW